MTGVEGYIESAASGFVAGLNAAYRAMGKEQYLFPEETMIGAMAWYIAHGDQTQFQPMNANFGIIAPLAAKVRGGKRAIKEAYAARALAMTDTIAEQIRPL